MFFGIPFLLGIALSILCGGIFRVTSLNSFSTLLQTLAAIGAVVVAYQGLSIWKKQLSEKIQNDLAKKCLIAIYKVRDAMEYVRSPLISLPEMTAALKHEGLDRKKIEDRDIVNRAVYAQRWKEVTLARTKLLTLLLEVEVEWGREAKENIFSINVQVAKLFANVSLFLDVPEESLYERDVVYGGIVTRFSDEISHSVKLAEDYLKTKFVK